eukprot:32130_1
MQHIALFALLCGLSTQGQELPDPMEATTAQIPCIHHTEYFGAKKYEIAESHNFHPESDRDNISLPAPVIGWTCWWASHGVDDYDPIGVAFTNAFVNEDTMDIIYESPLSKLVYKCWSYKGKDGQFHTPMFQVRGSNHSLVNAHVAYRIDLSNRTRWKRIGIKISKPAASTVEEDQTSFVVTEKAFMITEDTEIFTVQGPRDMESINSCDITVTHGSSESRNHGMILQVVGIVAGIIACFTFVYALCIPRHTSSTTVAHAKTQLTATTTVTASATPCNEGEAPPQYEECGTLVDKTVGEIEGVSNGGSGQSDYTNIKNWFHNHVGLNEYNELYLELFIKNGFDQLKLIRNMTKQDMIQIGIDKLGHQKQILLAIESL